MKHELTHVGFMSLYKKGYNDIDIADYFDITIITAIRFRGSLGLPANFNRKKIPKHAKTIKKPIVRYGIEMPTFNAFYKAGANDTDLSEIFQVSKCAIKTIRREFKYKMNTDRILTTSERYKLLLDSGLSVDDISVICHVSIATVRVHANKLGYKKAHVIDSMNIDEQVARKFNADKESLFCDTEFLKSFLNKNIKSAKRECED